MAKPKAFYAALNPGDEPARSEAETHAQRIGGYSRYVAFNQKIPGMGGRAAEAGWFVYEAQSQPTPPSQSPSPSRQTPTNPSGGGSRTGAQALQATMANQPQITGGGQGFSIGATQVGVTLPQRSDEFLGIDSLTPDNKLSVNHAPRSVNWDGFRRIGSRCVRAGIAKLAEDRDTMTASGGGSLSSEYRGLCIFSLPASGAQDDKLLVGLVDKDVEIGVAPGGSNSQTSLHIVTGDPRWGRPRDLTGVPGPTVTLSDQTGGVLRVNVVYTNVFPTAREELMKQTVKAVIIRYAGPFSGATPRYPLDPDGATTDGSADGTESTSFKTRSQAFDGTSTNFDTSALALGKWWVTVWCVSLEGISEPTFASKTLA